MPTTRPTRTNLTYNLTVICINLTIRIYILHLDLTRFTTKLGSFISLRRLPDSIIYIVVVNTNFLTYEETVVYILFYTIIQLIHAVAVDGPGQTGVPFEILSLHRNGIQLQINTPTGSLTYIGKCAGITCK